MSSAETQTSILSEKARLALLDRASSEIAVYRRRQITTFREMAIVQGLVTLGIGQLHIESQPMLLWIRVLAGMACLLSAGIGVWIIRSYKKRIYYIRDQRANLLRNLNGDLSRLFYPTEGQGITPEEEKKYKTSPTSAIYSWTLVALGVLTLVGNVVAGVANR